MTDFNSSIGAYGDPAAGKSVAATHVLRAFNNTLALKEAPTNFDWFTNTTSWTPTVTSSAGGTPTYTKQVGRYLKLGPLVIAWGRVTLASKGTLAAGDVSISGLPVSGSSVTDLFGSANFGFFSNLSTSIVSLFGFSTNTSIALRRTTAAATTPAALQVSEINTTFDVIFSLVYLADS